MFLILFWFFQGIVWNFFKEIFFHHSIAKLFFNICLNLIISKIRICIWWMKIVFRCKSFFVFSAWIIIFIERIGVQLQDNIIDKLALRIVNIYIVNRMFFKIKLHSSWKFAKVSLLKSSCIQTPPKKRIWLFKS